MANERGSAAPILLVLLVLMLLVTGAAVMLFSDDSGVGPASDANEAMARTDVSGAEPETLEADDGERANARREVSPDEVEPPEEDPEPAEEIVIPPDATGLTGRIIDRSGRPAVGHRVVVERSVPKKELETFGVELQPGRTTGHFARDAVALTGDDGRFVVIDVPPAQNFTIRVVGGGGLLGREGGVTVYDGLLFDVGDIPLRRGAAVAGRVRTESGRAIEGAEITLGWNWSSLPVVSDSKGHFDAGAVYPGRHQIRVKAKGYALARTVNREFVEGDNVPDLELVMVQASVIRGRLVDEAGRPVSGAWVTANRQAGEIGWFGEWFGDSVSTDDSGAFAFESLPAGSYRLHASARGFRSVNQSDVVAGGTPIEIRLQRASLIEGVVVDRRTGSPVVAERIELLWQPPWMKSAASEEFQAFWQNVDADIDPDGTFSIGLAQSGRFKVRASAEGYASGDSEPFELKKDSTVSGVLVQLEPGKTLSVKATDRATGAPVAGALVAVHEMVEKSNGGGAASGLMPMGRYVNVGAQRGRRVGRGVTDASGEARIESMVAGRFEILATRAGYAPTRVEGIEVHRASAVPTEVLVEFTVGGAIEGRVVNQRGEVEPALVVNAVSSTGDKGDAVTLENGQYLIENLAPGRYRVTSELDDGGQNDTFANVGWIANDVGGSPSDAEEHPVVVEAGQTATWDLTVDRIEPGSLKGTVLINGTPAADMQVMAMLDPAGSSDGSFGFAFDNIARTDERGGFSFRRLDPGAYLLTVTRGWSRTFDGGGARVMSSQETQVTVDLGLGGVNGRVVDADGRPIAGASVRARPPEQNGGQRQPFYFGMGGQHNTTTAADGTFSLDEMQAGTYQIAVTAQGYARSERPDVQVRASGQTGPLEITLERGGWLKITVDGVPPGSEQLRFRLTDPSGDRAWGQWARPSDDGFYWVDARGHQLGTLTVTTRSREGQPDLSGSSPIRVEEGENVELRIALGV